MSLLLGTRRKATVLGDALVWYHFVPASSTAGQQWYQEFQDSGAEEAAYALDRAVAYLRRGRQRDGEAELEHGRRWLDQRAGGAPESISGVIAEGYWAGFAYWQYRLGDLEGGFTTLATARDHVSRTLESAPFLVSFAQKSSQLVLNQARVARALRWWDLMWELIGEARAMVRGEAPLFVLSHGAVTWAEIDGFYRSVEPVDDLEAEARTFLLDRDRRIRGFERLALGASMPPFVATDAL